MGKNAKLLLNVTNNFGLVYRRRQSTVVSTVPGAVWYDCSILGPVYCAAGAVYCSNTVYQVLAFDGSDSRQIFMILSVTVFKTVSLLIKISFKDFKDSL